MIDLAAADLSIVLHFSTFWRGAMKNLEAAHLSIVLPFPCFIVRSDEKYGAPDLSIVHTFLIFRHKNASISNPILYRKTKI